MEEKLSQYSHRLYCKLCDIQFQKRTEFAEHNNVIHCECVIFLFFTRSELE